MCSSLIDPVNQAAAGNGGLHIIVART